MMTHERLPYLLGRYGQQALTSEERTELKGLLDNVNATELPDDLIESFLRETNSLYSLKQSDTEIDQVLQAVFAIDKVSRHSPVLQDEQSNNHPVRRVHFMRKWGWAAAIILFLGSGVFLYTVTKKTERPLADGDKPLQTDILPGTNKALLTLSDGTAITLDTAGSGAIAQQGNTSILKLSTGEIVYTPRGASEANVLMNTMTIPRGGQYQLQLSDGSKIWLNASSSVTYPAVFIGKERKIKITGEVYLEVAKDKSRPFMVDIDGKSVVEVLGTSFNINSYADEGLIKTTLVEGSVKVRLGNDAQVLKPGQQAVSMSSRSEFGTGSDRQLRISDEVDLSQVLAWKNGYFNFKDVSLKHIASQLERWYDIEVQFEENAPEIILRGEMDRGVRLSGIIQFLTDFGVTTRLEGRTLIVTGK